MANKTVSVPMALAVKMELWRRGCFDFITTRDGKKHEKQSLALQILTDEDHVEILPFGCFLCAFAMLVLNGLLVVLN